MPLGARMTSEDRGERQRAVHGASSRREFTARWIPSIVRLFANQIKAGGLKSNRAMEPSIGHQLLNTAVTPPPLPRRGQSAQQPGQAILSSDTYGRK